MILIMMFFFNNEVIFILHIFFQQWSNFYTAHFINMEEGRFGSCNISRDNIVKNKTYLQTWCVLRIIFYPYWTKHHAQRVIWTILHCKISRLKRIINDIVYVRYFIHRYGGINFTHYVRYTCLNIYMLKIDSSDVNNILCFTLVEINDSFYMYN